MCFKWMNKQIKQFDWQDISLIKLSAFLFGVLLAKYWTALRNIEWYWLVGIIMLTAIPVAMKMFKK